MINLDCSPTGFLKVPYFPYFTETPWTFRDCIRTIRSSNTWTYSDILTGSFYNFPREESEEVMELKDLFVLHFRLPLDIWRTVYNFCMKLYVCLGESFPILYIPNSFKLFTRQVSNWLVTRLDRVSNDRFVSYVWNILIGSFQWFGCLTFLLYTTSFPP